jgi:RNA polymerase sigma-70 factor, ECF subfamily
MLTMNNEETCLRDGCATTAEDAPASERRLIERVRLGDNEAFYELVRPCERGVYLAALSIVRNDSDAEEVAQEAILKGFKYLGRFRSESKFSTWLIQIAINEAKMKLRKNHPQLYESLQEGRRSDDGDYLPRDFADWREIPSEALTRRELRQALSQALAALPEKYRSVLVLRDIQQLSIHETAQILGISEGNVKTRLSRARLQMRDALAPGWTGAWNRHDAGRSYIRGAQ